MSHVLENIDEHTRLLSHAGNKTHVDAYRSNEDTKSTSSLPKISREQALPVAAAGEDLPHKDYSTVETS